MKPQRPQFLAPFYAKTKNALLGRGGKSRLNPYSDQRRRRKTPYECDDLEEERGWSVSQRR